MKVNYCGEFHNWYVADLDCYEADFLRGIIISLVEEKDNQSHQTKPLSGLASHTAILTDAAKLKKDKTGESRKGFYDFKEIVGIPLPEVICILEEWKKNKNLCPCGRCEQVKL